MAADKRDNNADYAHFAAIPWCAAHLEAGAGEKEAADGTMVTTKPWIRTPKADGEDSLWARTLQTARTVPFMLQVWRAPEAADRPVDEVRLLLTLADDVNGVAGVCHGGLVATILDEVAGMLVEVNKRRPGVAAVATGATYMTAYLHVRYLRPVPSSASLLARCRLRKVDGRKLFSDAWVEDAEANVLARAECLYVALKSAL